MLMSEIMVTLPQSTYIKLLEDEFLLSCLREAGVDNWDGYDYAMELYNEDTKEDDK